MSLLFYHMFTLFLYLHYIFDLYVKSNFCIPYYALFIALKHNSPLFFKHSLLRNVISRKKKLNWEKKKKISIEGISGIVQFLWDKLVIWLNFS